MYEQMKAKKERKKLSIDGLSSLQLRTVDHHDLSDYLSV